MPDSHYRPSRDNPLLIMAMDHRESFGRTLFDVRNDKPDAEQRAAMQAAGSARGWRGAGRAG